MLFTLAFAASLCCAAPITVSGAHPAIAVPATQAAPVIPVKAKWPGTGRKKERGKGGGEGRKRGREEAEGSESGKCGRLAEKYGIPKGECRKMSGEKKCKRLARKHGLPADACKSL